MDYKTIKRELRRMGVAHRDVAAFIRVYKKIRQQGKGRMVKDIMGPMVPSGMPVLDLGHRQIGRMWAEHYAPREWLGQTQYEDLEGHFRLQIARRLADELVSGDAVVWSQRMEMKGGQTCYVLRGSLDVVLPEEENHRKPKAEGLQPIDQDEPIYLEPWPGFGYRR